MNHESNFPGFARCLFCNLSKTRIVGRNEHAFAIRDAYPVTKYHTLIIPWRHEETYFGLNTAEVCAVHELLVAQEAMIGKLDSSVTGFNIGMNCGKAAGQTVFHCHVHLIPRRAGDMVNPKGGIRHIIPGKGDYTLTTT